MTHPRRDTATEVHERWLGMAQPVEGLVVSVPVLVEAQCGKALPLSVRDRLAALCRPLGGPGGSGPPVADFEAILFDPELLGFAEADFDREGAIPEELSLYVPEGHQLLAPTLALRRRDSSPRGSSSPQDPESDPETPPAARAGRAYEMLVWILPDGLDLDRPEAATGPWLYPPARKFERLLRHVRVPIGVLANGAAARLFYAPHGEAAGWLTFRLADLSDVGGRPLLDAFVMLLSRASFYGRAPEARLPALLAASRRRQADVTEKLAVQVFGALETLLAGFEAAAERDGGDNLEAALKDGGESLYGGLLTVLLRLVFVLYAENRNLLPVDRDLWAEHYSLLGLFDQLQKDAAEHPDAMDRRFGAWDRLLALFRAIWLGVEHGAPDDPRSIRLPPRRGRLFDPHEYPFLEGWRGGSAPIVQAEDRAAVRTPSVPDGTVWEVLRRLLIFEGQRLSYSALDVEQIGSVYEALMGYKVERLLSPAVCVKESRAWVEVGRLLDLAPARRASWLEEEAGLGKANAKRLAAAVQEALAGAAAEDRDAQEAAALAALEAFRAAGTRPADPGRLILQPGSERRRTSSHYTPRSLSEPIVRRTLEPLLATLGSDPKAEEILELKVCDPAMGSGAFLVAACRFLADRVVAAWTREGRLEAGSSAIPGDPTTHALRRVAQRCLYGVDKNRYAVDLAKLSLWLLTSARDLPFTFVDHALHWGDSLVGLSFDQIRSFHWLKQDQDALTTGALEEALDEAIALRRELQELEGQGAEEQRQREALLRDADDALDHARLLGDLVVGAFFAASTDRERRLELARRLTKVHEWLDARDGGGGGGGLPPADLEEMRRQIRKEIPIFHWMLELPEIFYADRPDPLDGGKKNRMAFIDGFVGNPPFAGKNSIAESNVPGYVDWLKAIHPNSHGNADLSAHFFLRAAGMLGAHGTIGLVATNTIAQGDTRATALQPMVNGGFSLYDATRNLPWPGDAAVTVSVVHLAKGAPSSQQGKKRLNGSVVEDINSRLRAKPERPDPEVLAANREQSYVGSYVLGMGFTLTPAEREALVAKDPRNTERILPYLGGEEVNSSPTQSFHRYVISFGQIDLEEAERWPDLLAIVREKVKPERDRLKDNADGRHRKDYWWQFGRETPALTSILARYGRCLVTSRVSKHLILSFQPTDRIFAETLFVFPLPTQTAFAILQSRLHESWARLLSSSLEDRLRYAASDCFETFPFPEADPRAEIPALEAIGEALYTARADWLIETNQGLTDAYNRLKDPHDQDPRAVELRRLHEEMDRAVLAAYGWTDLQVPPFATPATEPDRRRLEQFTDDAIDRLFILNSQRAEQERREGLDAVKPRKPAKKPATKKPKRGTEGQGGLF